MLLYHAGFDEIKIPDIFHGRKNADFGQGFYTTSNRDFAYRWAKQRNNKQTIVNNYELNLEGLKVKHFSRNQEWFSYIYNNRNKYPDLLDYDIIIGPIANDTIYDVFGIISSGMLTPEQAMELLLIGPQYEQITIKTEKAVRQLTWLSSEILSTDQITFFRSLVSKEEASYQDLFAKKINEIL